MPRGYGTLRGVLFRAAYYLHERLDRARAAGVRVVLEIKTAAALESSVPQLLEFGGSL